MSHNELHGGDDLLALRTHIGRLAMVGGVDIGNDAVVALLLAGDFSGFHLAAREAELLRALLVLLYRLEASVSEDLGIEGLTRLWRQHDDLLARHGFPVRSQPAFHAATH
jgi:hypothetical protein